MSQTPKQGSQPYHVLKTIWRRGTSASYLDLTTSCPTLSRKNFSDIVSKYALLKHEGNKFSLPDYLTLYFEDETRPVAVKELGQIVPSREARPFKEMTDYALGKNLRVPVRQDFCPIATGTSVPQYRDLG
jgi:hypothetical protein